MTLVFHTIRVRRRKSVISDLFRATEIFNPLAKSEADWKDFNHRIDNVNKAKERTTKVIHFVRHGEGIHNVAEREFGTQRWEAEIALKEDFLDPCLTEEGKRQCSVLGKALGQALNSGMPITYIVSSPFTRALETAELALSDAPLTLTKSRVVHELCRETLGRHTCDKRSPVSIVAPKFPGWDFTTLQSDTDAMWSSRRETPREVQERARAWLQQIWADPRVGSHLLLVNHSGFISACFAELGGGWKKLANAEIVSVIVEGP